MRSFIVLAGLIVCVLAAFTPSQSFTIHGKVVDASGNGISGAIVKVKGTTTAVTTDVAGAFTLHVDTPSVILMVSSVGFTNKEIKVEDNGKPVNIVLSAEPHAMQEVVVVGYGQKKRMTATASTKSIRSDAIYGSRSPSGISNELKGQVSGVAINHRRQPKRLQAGGTYHGIDRRHPATFNTEEYDAIVENRFLSADKNPLSTFSVDVDAASYSNMRRFLQMGQMPPAGAIRTEELINYFRYNYPQPSGPHPFSITTEMAECPWNDKHRLVLVGLQGKKIATENLPASNLVFLIDVSGSMDDPLKLPLVKSSLRLLVEQLRQQDLISMVVYAGNAGLVLPATRGSEKQVILDAIERLQAGGSTAGGAGIQLAYKTAKENFIAEGNNRVILCTDGDFNVGVSSNDELERMIEVNRETGVFLTVLGYGMGNYQDSKMQRLAGKGNGNHSYIDNLLEARKVLVNEFGGTLFTIAKDVKLQIEFNPSKVQAYRLIGYENRLLNKEDFNNDKKDGGDLGSGHSVTALYEIIPAGVSSTFIEKVDELKYQSQPVIAGNSSELMTIKFRYKQPDQNKSRLLEHVVKSSDVSLKETSANFRFAAAVASFAMVLRGSEFRQNASYEQAWSLAKDALEKDEEGYRAEFLKLIKNAQSLTKASAPADKGGR